MNTLDGGQESLFFEHGVKLLFHLCIGPADCNGVFKQSLRAL
jgi:hypothetical protein